MSLLTVLKGASTLHDVAALLGFQPPALAYILYVKPPLAKYNSFDVPKRGGGVRKIKAPSPDLLLLQQRLSDLLQHCVEEINRACNRKDDMAHGFKQHGSHLTK